MSTPKEHIRTHEPGELMMWGYQRANMNMRVWGCEDARIQASTHKPGNTTWCDDARIQPNTKEPEHMMQGCKDESKHTWTWGYKDVTMQGCQQVHMNLDVQGCKDARIYSWTWGYKKAWRWDYRRTFHL